MNFMHSSMSDTVRLCEECSKQINNEDLKKGMLGREHRGTGVPFS